MNIDLYSKEIALFFDKLRFQRNMTQEEFTDDIVSLRQFRRYLSGEYQIPQKIFNKLSNKLGFKPEHLILEFESDKFQETQLLNKLNNYIVNKDFESAKLIFNQIDVEHLIDTNNTLIYKYSLFLMHFYQNIITPNQYILEIKHLVNYDSIFNKNILSSTEIILLSSLLPLKAFEDKIKVINILEKYINQQKTIISGHNDRLLLLCLYYIALFYGSQKVYNKVIDYCAKAIEFCHNLKLSYLLEDFYYYSALAYHAINDKDKFEEFLFRCYCILNAENNRSKINKYYALFVKDFGIEVESEIIKYIKNK